LATVSARWGIKPLNARHAAAASFASAIDPGLVKAEMPLPPVMMPKLDMSKSAIKNWRPTEPQHPELVESLKQQGLWQRLMRETIPNRC
jgi:hypothetical protein